MGRALVATRPCRDDPDRAGPRVNRVVDVMVVGDRQTAAVGAEVGRLLVLPHAGFQLAEIGRESPRLPVVSPKGFHQTVCGETRRLSARLPHLDQRGGYEANDERGERQAEKKEGDSQFGFAGCVHAGAPFSLMRFRTASAGAGLSGTDGAACDRPNCRSSIRGKRMVSCGMTCSSSST